MKIFQIEQRCRAELYPADFVCRRASAGMVPRPDHEVVVSRLIARSIRT